MGTGSVCQIGEHWFYFGGITAEGLDPDEYVACVPQEDIVQEIFDALDDIRKEGFMDEYLYYYFELLKKPQAANKAREFFIHTPIGELKVYSKHKHDCSADFPGVFIDLVRGGEDDAPIACVEYDSVGENILATIYGQLYSDTPTDIRHIDVSGV